jgi:hypothetical protein
MSDEVRHRIGKGYIGCKRAAKVANNTNESVRDTLAECILIVRPFQGTHRGTSLENDRG